MILLQLLAVALMAQTRPAVTLENGAARVMIDKLGGSFVRFEFKDQKLNPLVWSNDNPGMEPKAMSHFLCVDRWGQVSEAEGKSGMPYHGEATRMEWKADTSGLETKMATHLPIANMDVQRRAKLHDSLPVLMVWESVTNRNPLGRPYNMVQHPTIGPPFLDASVVVDSNARRGFSQSNPLPNPEEPSSYWPQALKDGQPVNLRHLVDDPNPNVVSFVVEDEYGWVTAANAGKGLLLGYIWKTAEYPWLSIWRHVDAQNKPLARGLEFGTTGLHQPFYVLAKKARVFGRPTFEWLEPAETQTRSFAAFLVKIPANYKGVAQVVYRGGKLTLKERDGVADRDINLNTGDLFTR